MRNLGSLVIPYPNRGLSSLGYISGEETVPVLQHRSTATPNWNLHSRWESLCRHRSIAYDYDEGCVPYIAAHAILCIDEATRDPAVDRFLNSGLPPTRIHPERPLDVVPRMDRGETRERPLHPAFELWTKWVQARGRLEVLPSCLPAPVRKSRPGRNERRAPSDMFVLTVDQRAQKIIDVSLYCKSGGSDSGEPSWTQLIGLAAHLDGTSALGDQP